MIDLSDCFELGTITKNHGVRGQVVVRLNNLSFDDIKEMETVFIEIDGLPVPFFITEYSEHSKETIVLTIDDINKEEDAKKLVNCHVYIKSSQVERSENPIQSTNFLIGFTVIDMHAVELGVIDEILNIDNNPLLRIVRNKQEVLLPLHEDLVHEIDVENKIIRVKVPEGLMDLS
jgi:16S rRNA processing protein RimM